MAESVKISNNKSFLFLLPLLKLKSNAGIIETYIGNVNDSTDENLLNYKLYVLCYTSNYYIESYKGFISKEKTLNDNVLYTVKFPEEFNLEYKHFVDGKYSKFSEAAKKILCANACKNTIKSIKQTNMYGVLYKTAEKRKELEEKLDIKLNPDAELASIIDINREVYGL